MGGEAENEELNRVGKMEPGDGRQKFGDVRDERLWGPVEKEEVWVKTVT